MKVAFHNSLPTGSKRIFLSSDLKILVLHRDSRSISISNTQVWSSKILLCIPVLRPEYTDWPLKGQCIEPINTNYKTIGIGLHPIINLKVIDAIVLSLL